MKNISTHSTEKFNDNTYKELGFMAQRKYPNEELCRFMGRNFFSKNLTSTQIKNTKILETGCGSGANIWMIAREGFDVYGIDLSKEAIKLSGMMLDNYGVNANLSVQDMTELDFEDNYFDVIVDVFSSCSLSKDQRLKYLKKVFSLLKPDGLFFSYFPSKKSDVFLYPDNANFIDSDTLDGIVRKDAPFSPTHHPFSFMHPLEYKGYLSDIGFKVQYLETIQRTYRNQSEIFSYIVIEGRK